tara:strand:- start:488 stop:1240 length:753 start_codon:yes stop_codon:yes gene_type:complete
MNNYLLVEHTLSNKNLFFEIIDIIRSLPERHVVYGLVSTLLCVSGVWIYSHCSQKIKLIIIQTISWLVIVNEFFFQFSLIFYDMWNLKNSLPLEMCYISALLIPVFNYFPNIRSLKSWFFFAGFGGSFFAFLNTNLSEMDMVYMSIHYFFAHGLVIFVMLIIVVDGFRPTWNDYFKTILYTSFLVIVISMINYLLDSNYMFTRSKPPGTTFAELMPGWPYYFVIMLLIGLVFYTFLMVVSFIPTTNKKRL